MSMQPSAVDAHAAAASARPPRSVFVEQERIPWAEWVMPGTWFKLLSINPFTGGFGMMLKVAPDTPSALHAHYGSVEAYILSGSLEYPGDVGRAGDVVVEHGGIQHQPTSGAEGLLLYAVSHGPLGGVGADGTVTGVVDARAMYELAVAAGTAGHLERPSHW